MPNAGQTPHPRRPSLAAIITAARAGGLGHAWDLFVAGGYDRSDADPAALAVKGRLLKDRALRAAPADRPAAFTLAANAYAAADALEPQPYTRINVATLRLLGGDPATAATIARGLLAWLDQGGDMRETPYYLAATRAEALLLCADAAAAEAALDQAVAHDPDGWSDRASTLRQLRVILTAQRRETAWLDRFRPPRSLHFAGHLGVASEGSDALRTEIAAYIDRERIGFGYGALAAGSDILIAEALLDHDAELHVILPTGLPTFIAQSIAPYGEDWRARFDACLDRATSLRTLTGVTGDYEPLATRLAADVAMGSALMNARQLESEAVQLLVADEGEGRYGAGLAIAGDAARWTAGGHRQHVLRWARNAPVAASGHRTQPEGRSDRRLLALLLFAFDGLDHLDEGAFAHAVDEVLGPFDTAIAGSAAQPDLLLPHGNARIAAFADPDAAWRYARAILALAPATLPLRVAGHYALVHQRAAPAALIGAGIAALETIAASAMPGVLSVSDALASVLFVTGARETLAETIGEAAGMRLIALTGAPEDQ